MFNKGKLTFLNNTFVVFFSVEYSYRLKCHRKKLNYSI